jgi:hypothetical protein
MIRGLLLEIEALTIASTERKIHEDVPHIVTMPLCGPKKKPSAEFAGDEKVEDHSLGANKQVTLPKFLEFAGNGTVVSTRYTYVIEESAIVSGEAEELALLRELQDRLSEIAKEQDQPSSNVEQQMRPAKNCVEHAHKTPTVIIKAAN